MPISRRFLLQSGLAMSGAAALGGLPALASEDVSTGMTPDEALKVLRNGNAAFIAGRPHSYPNGDARRRLLARGQHPFATIVCCSDSRAAPEQLFEVGLGQLFVIRNAGSTVANPQAMGSIEYSVEHLGVPLIVVLGHSNCGAVKAAIEVADRQAKLPGHMGEMVTPILPAVTIARQEGGDLVQHSVRHNIQHVVHELRAPAELLLARPRRAGKLKVVGAEYSLETGMVDFFDLE